MKRGRRQCDGMYVHIERRRTSTQNIFIGCHSEPPAPVRVCVLFSSITPFTLVFNVSLHRRRWRRRRRRRKIRRKKKRTNERMRKERETGSVRGGPNDPHVYYYETDWESPQRSLSKASPTRGPIHNRTKERQHTRQFKRTSETHSPCSVSYDALSRTLNLFSSSTNNKQST